MPSDFCLEDDKIRELFDAAYFLMELENVHNVIKKCWADASHGSIPLPLAAWMNNFAVYSIAREIPPKFVYVCSNLAMNPEMTCKFFSKLSNKVDPRTLLSHARRFFMLAQVINDYGRTLIGKPMLDIQGVGVVCNIPECQCKFSLPKGLVPRGDLKGDEISESDKATGLSVFETMRDDLTNTRAIGMLEATKPLTCGCFTPVCDSFLFGARNFFSQIEPIASSRLVAALNLFFVTEQSATTTLGAKITRPHSRFRSIRLAIDFRNSLLPVMKSLDAMGPNCRRAKYWHEQLQKVRDGLEAYASEKMFDTYHTSPWIVGSHMTEILTAAFAFGYLVNSEWAVISSALHLYNAMRHGVTSTPRIPVFDDLSQVLIQSIFGAKLPERNFCSTFRRIVYHSKMEKTANADGKLYRLQAGLMNRPETMDIDSGFVDQHFSNHESGPLFQGQVLGIPYQPELGQKSYNKIEEARSKLTLSEYMEKAKSTALMDIEGPHPIARVNFFAVFTLCSKFLTKFGSLEKSFVPMDKFESLFADQTLRNDIFIGRCHAELLMESIDDFSNSKQGRRHLERMRSPRNAVQAFEEIDPETTLAQCMWNL
ncbi:hypothetical protein CGLO_08802 [Colletotrichum gloeosporioides Cg-14]|uniref:Uncharacterized protein n=1 Tax=Colletotrichum gloeosporioides (strain Cg-14) TaxID=1237896 RepID=T0KF97_COLGC|nr:hypothetical protein CGLO_08802 [Colletotrichum gloeosporioides Cg-14]